MAEPFGQELAALSTENWSSKSNVRKGAREVPVTLHSCNKSSSSSSPTLLNHGSQTRIPPVVRQVTNEQQKAKEKKNAFTFFVSP